MLILLLREVPSRLLAGIKLHQSMWGLIMQDFDLSLACALGACSFEAYHIAYHMHGIKVLTSFPKSPHRACASP